MERVPRLLRFNASLSGKEGGRSPLAPVSPSRRSSKAELNGVAGRVHTLGWRFSRICLSQEQQKTKKKKKSTKKKALQEEPRKVSQDCSSPEPNMDSQDSSLADHEYTAGTGKAAGGSQPMAPGVFLTQRRPSTSSQNVSSGKGERGVTAEAKGERNSLPRSAFALVFRQMPSSRGTSVPLVTTNCSP